MTQQPSSDRQSIAWFDELFEVTEFLFANCGNFTPPLHVHETFAIGVIESGGQLFQLGRSPSLVMPEGTLSAINPGTVHGGGRQVSAAGSIECSIRRTHSLRAHWKSRTVVLSAESGALDNTSSMIRSFIANSLVCTCHRNAGRFCWNGKHVSPSLFGDCSSVTAISLPKRSGRVLLPGR